MQWNMKWKAGLLLAAVAVGGLVMPGRTRAQGPGNAYATSFTTSITYQNVGNADAAVTLECYDEQGTKTVVTRPTLAKGAGTSIFIGGVEAIKAGFKGTCVMSATEPVVATMVQIPTTANTPVKNRPLVNGFTDTDSGSRVLIATVLKNMFAAQQFSIFSVQNVDTQAANFTLRFYPLPTTANPNPSPITVTTLNVPANAAHYYDMGKITEITSPTFNGSVQIESVRAGTSTPGKIVAAALELNQANIGAAGFEGVTGGARTVYMPSALCNAFGGQNTAYAVQNNGSAQTQVTVTYSNGTVASKAIPAGAKQSFVACQDGFPPGSSGSATITTAGPNDQIVAIGKVFGVGLSTAFLGATAGANRLALPYVRFTQTRFDPNPGNRQRTFIAIQNVGSEIPANGISIDYLDKDGNLVGTHTIAATVATGGKVNSNPTSIGPAGNEFGYSGSQFGGSAIVRGPAGAQLVAVARVCSFVSTSESACEDYNGITAP